MIFIPMVHLALKQSGGSKKSIIRYHTSHEVDITFIFPRVMSERISLKTFRSSEMFLSDIIKGI